MRRRGQCEPGPYSVPAIERTFSDLGVAVTVVQARILRGEIERAGVYVDGREVVFVIKLDGAVVTTVLERVPELPASSWEVTPAGTVATLLLDRSLVPA